MQSLSVKRKGATIKKVMLMSKSKNESIINYYNRNNVITIKPS